MIRAFLALDLPGSKVVVGDGPARAELAAHAEHYKQLSGFSVDVLNGQPPILGAV